MPKHYVFIQYRHDMVFDDHVIFRVDFLGMIESSMNTLIQEGHLAYPSGQGADPQRVNSSILAHEALESINNVVPLYCEPMSTFVTFAHNYNHALHHAYDYKKARELPETFGCSEEDIVIAECIISQSGDSCVVNTHTFSDYFADLMI